MSDAPLMPKATAVWLVDNTALTFRQIADFCGLHELEVKAIADEESAQGIKGLDPIANGQLSRDDLEKAEADPKHKLKLAKSKVQVPTKRTRGPRYTPVSRRQDRPNAIRWLVRNHPELADAQIIRLVGTTKPTIAAIRDGTHWNSANLQPLDPVTLGLCSQIDLDHEVARAAKRAGVVPEAVDESSTLRPAEETTAEETYTLDAPEPRQEEEEVYTADSVFGKLAEKFGSRPAADEDEDDDAL